MGIPVARHLQTTLMPAEKLYDVIVAGGGLSGLALSIQLAQSGYTVLVIEKENYPLQRVCGEYISLESLAFLRGLGLDPYIFGATSITLLEVSDTSGQTFKLKLPLGGFGISRHLLDAELARLAQLRGVEIITDCKVYDIIFQDDKFEVVTSSSAYQGKVVSGSFGKRSNMDVKWKRPFTKTTKNRLNNFVGVKYHMHGTFPDDLIALHIFENGYCGIVKVEANKYNVCYLTAATNVIRHKGDLEEMEQAILSRNPALARALTQLQKIHPDAVTIAQVSFEKKSQVHDHILLTGDAAGMIAPLCGNGMSMAFHSSRIAAHHIATFLNGATSRLQMEQGYAREWKKVFSSRLATGRMIQRLTSHRLFMKIFVFTGRMFPSLMKLLISRTHGQPF